MKLPEWLKTKRRRELEYQVAHYERTLEAVLRNAPTKDPILEPPEVRSAIAWSYWINGQLVKGVLESYAREAGKK